MISKKRNAALNSLVLALGTILLSTGCYQSYSITVRNDSGVELTDVKCDNRETGFEYGTLGDGKEASFMNAETKFGSKPPENLNFSFKDNELDIEYSVKVPDMKEEREILFVVDKDLEISVDTR